MVTFYRENFDSFQMVTIDVQFQDGVTVVFFVLFMFSLKEKKKVTF
jgi:hypothetical protein